MNLSLINLSKRAKTLVLLGIFTALTGCASVYVDGNSPEVPVANLKKPSAPQPTQLIFEFQTHGVANVAATNALKSKVVEQIEASGLFSQVSSDPTPNGATLSLNINNIALTENAASKGFVAGLTFGIAGQTVGDGYDLNLRYFGKAGADKPAIAKQGKHVIYTSIGSSAPPEGAIKTADTNEAVFLMLKQALSRLLNELSLDPQFN